MFATGLGNLGNAETECETKPYYWRVLEYDMVPSVSENEIKTVHWFRSQHGSKDLGEFALGKKMKFADGYVGKNCSGSVSVYPNRERI